MNGNDFEALKLEDHLCFPLYAASKELINRGRPYLDRLNLTYTQYLVMLVLWQHGTLNLKELGKKLYLDSGTLTPVLKSLEAKGYLRRYRSSADERVLLLELEEAGRALRERARELPELESGVTGLDEEENAELCRLLYKLLDRMEKPQK
ncbi:MAG: MarR family transcriptional regulator [Oscillospiraceae bacterium]|nr:MarR family transcriptional regulator [Oscillospiraceae bacterium]